MQIAKYLRYVHIKIVPLQGLQDNLSDLERRLAEALALVATLKEREEVSKEEELTVVLNVHSSAVVNCVLSINTE